MQASSQNGDVVALFVPDISEVSTIKRAQELLDNGFAVTVFGFRRARYNRDYRPTWPFVELGRTFDRRYWHRMFALASALRRLFGARMPLGRATLLYARNIDQLMLALLVKRVFRLKADVSYEVLDLPPALTDRGLTPRLLRLVERYCLRQVKLLVVSSPGFMRNHYLSVQRYAKPWFLLENKLHPSILNSVAGVLAPAGRHGPTAPGYRWVVGYFGLIRGQRTFDLMTRVAERLRDRVLFKFGGILTTVDSASFVAALEHNKNMVYEGDYVSPRDLERLYTRIDFAWAIDLENAEHNSRWLLPCRFYEAGIFGVPCLAARDFEVGRLVGGLDVGWTFAEPLEDAIVAFFERITAREYAEKRGRLASLPVSTFVAGEDVRTLCDLLRGREAAELPLTAEAQTSTTGRAAVRELAIDAPMRDSGSP